MAQQNSHSTSNSTSPSVPKNTDSKASHSRVTVGEQPSIEPNHQAPSIHSVNPFQSGFRKWLFHKLQDRTRIKFAWLFALLSIFVTKDYPSGGFLISGVAISFIGACIRYWGSGYLRKDNTLTVAGPYAYTRNPLYLGTFLMAVGASLLSQSLILATLATLGFGVIYHFVILAEEEKLKVLFAQPYLTYMTLVARFFPRIGLAKKAELKALNPYAETFEFSHALANRNKAYEAFISFVALVGTFFFIAWVKTGI